MGSEVEQKENPRKCEKTVNGKIPDTESYPSHQSLPDMEDITDAITKKENAAEKEDQNDTHASPSPSSSPRKSGEDHASRALDYNNEDGKIINTYLRTNSYGQERVLQPHSQLPKPEIPPGILQKAPPPRNDDVSSLDMPAIGKLIREKSNGWSSAILKRLSSLKDSGPGSDPDTTPNRNRVTEFSLSGLKVVVKLKNEEVEEEQRFTMKGRISFFSRSNCRDCTAVRRFLRERGLKFVEINVDVFPEREKELIDRTGSSTVPQVFFNEKLFGGLVALNSLRNSGMLEQRLRDALSVSCPAHAPAPPVYGFDNLEEEDPTDELVPIVRFLRQRLPIQDRLMKMKIIKNCFSGTELVDSLVQQLDLGKDFTRFKAIEIGKHLLKRHFINHVFGENDLLDGDHFYRFLEHEPFIPKCFNFHTATNDSKPKPAVAICQRLTKIMSAILESYASDDRQHVDYAAISKSEEFRRYVNMTQDLQRVNLIELSENEKLAFFINLYNAMVIHAIIRIGCPEGVIDRRSFYSNFMYVVGGDPYSLNNIKNGILRSNRRSPYSLMKPFAAGDRRLEVAVIKVNPLIHFGLCNGTKSSPKVRLFSFQGVEDELRCAAREFFENGGVEIDLEKRTVYLTRMIKWFNGDFGQEREILKWLINYVDANKAGLLTHLLGDSGPVSISYQNFDSSINS
ncbi:hypothetical protein L6164_001067 [Bauhinia variegata]|uniref:Uncharacterized protein n=1 Tax=Bauhinia variegata TaxID=167791 RepID=A0ACB9Q8D6_BAUVA|nr:hypothetical protein L6164_001067 [Bauhinia variegata]